MNRTVPTDPHALHQLACLHRAEQLFGQGFVPDVMRVC